jgi:hypothetical protein
MKRGLLRRLEATKVALDNSYRFVMLGMMVIEIALLVILVLEARK